jgi:SAM-dependent MidA family methyltransferase
MTLAGLTTQGAFLASLDLGDLLVQLQQDETASVADYLAAQAAVYRLIDPGGLGRFGVLLMAKNAPVEPPLRGMAVNAPGF